jgi:hypothetical protein
MRHRTALVTIALTVAVVLAGAAAIGVNLGILTAADASVVGKLPATGSEAWASTPAGADAGAAVADASQRYIIENAGAVVVVTDGSTVRATDVSVRRGWKYRLVQTSDARVVVTFERGKRTYKFVAEVGKDGALVARVDEPVTRVVAKPAAASAATAAGSSSGATSSTARPAAHDADDADDYEEEEHEGGDDDD